MPSYPKKKPLTEAERHDRFVHLAKASGADREAPNFDQTIEALAKQKREPDPKAE